ncbi:PQQ-dependent sugar dehydrogenase [Chitinilyticum piscinae]|uniref:PQQ-dependent sugar dehydrogenase n=1 Tax=Chitinilyticum piscinae TaxID=2866724 RepID=A0A8J7KDH3_9NEIS|nr:PQQ-dependent sugar dehydrogenase [Chitinilyticum piscinae]MBE9608769.1 PQQ-dependent sugar dehydrogenase [Chitinilyticum piscinae]
MPHILLLLSLLTSAVACAGDVMQSEKVRFEVSVLTRGLTHPWSLAFLPDGRMLVTERPGRLRLLGRDGLLQPEPVAGTPAVIARGQGGLLDVALHPDFVRTGWVYLAYAGAEDRGSSTQVVRGKLTDDAGVLRLTQLQQIYRQKPAGSSDVHYGARLVFDKQGGLHIAQGERGEMQRAQQLDDLAGKSIRLLDDGRYPPDNPFAGRKGAHPAIYSLGHRNMQGAALNPQTGEIWATEHGPQGGDELNILRAGRNYGWPVITYGANYGSGSKIGEGTTKAGMEQPIHQWTPSIAPSGLAFYAGSAFPAWRGNLFAGALKYQMLVRLELDGDRVIHEERLLQNRYGRIRDVRTGPDGLIYLLTDEEDGALLRLSPVPR